MKELIKKDYHVVSVNEDVAIFGCALMPGYFVVVIDAKNKQLGVLTYSDLKNSTEKRIRNLDFIKPRLNNDASLKEACDLMKSSGSDALPVYDKDGFVGVLSLHDIVAYLLEKRPGLKRHFNGPNRILRG